MLENCYHSWCDQPRRRLERAYLDVLKALMADSAARNDLHGALAYGEQILDREPVDERTHRGLMLLRFRMGDRIGALLQYQDCVQALKRELAIAPEHETRALCDQIAAGRVGARDGWTPLLPALPQPVADDRRLSALIAG